MAFSNICLTNNTTTTSGYKISRKTPNNQTANLYLCFMTEIGPNDGYKWYDIALTFSTISKGASETSSYGLESAEYYERFAESSFVSRKVGNRWIWYLPLDIDNSKLDMVNSGSFTYTNRRFDAIKLNVRLDRVDDQGKKLNIQTSETLYILYAPQYIINQCYITSYGVIFKYTVSPDWTRNDDRALIYASDFTLSKGSSTDWVSEWVANLTDRLNNTNRYGGSILRSGISSTYLNFLGNNKLGLPAAYMSTAIPTGSILSGRMYISPSYDPDPTNALYEVTFSNLPIVDATKCNPISVELLAVGEDDPWQVIGDLNVSRVGVPGALFLIKELKQGYANADEVVIKMSPSEYNADTKVVTMYNYTYDDSGNVTNTEQLYPNGIRESVQYLPLNREVLLTVQPFGQEDSTNTIHAFKVKMERDTIFLTALDAEYENYVEIRYNYLPSWTSKPDVNLVKLAGRDRQSAYYGTGGSVDGTISGVIIDKDVDPRIVVQDPSRFENMPFYGDCMLQTPDGERRWVSITSMDIKPKQLGMSFWKDITIGLTEVR